MSRLRTVVVGIGANIWPLHRPALEAIGAEIAAVYDSDPDATRAAAASLGCRAASGLADLLAETAELGVVLTPQSLHAEHAIACLEAGFHVLVEKPLAISASEADAMLAAAERCGRLLAVALQQRTRHEVRDARRLLEEGVVGELQRIDLLATWPRRSDYFAAAPWRAAPATSGAGSC